MPNWCYTSFVIEGDEKEICDLYNVMRSLEMKQESLVPNGFGNCWLGNVVTALGENWNDIPCRGEFRQLQILDKSSLAFDTETAWCPPSDFIDLLASKYPSIKHYYMSEEPGCGVYETNDKDGIYFPDRYIVEDPDNGGHYYFTKDEEDRVYEYVSNITGVSVSSMEQAQKAVERYNDEHDSFLLVKSYRVVKY